MPPQGISLMRFGLDVGAAGQRGPMLDVTLGAAEQAVEHHKIAEYGTLRTLARSAGMNDAAELLEQTLREEKATDEKLAGGERRQPDSPAEGSLSDRSLG